MVLAAVKDVYLASLDAALPLGATKEVLRGNAEAVLKALLNAVLFSAPREMVRDCGDAAKAIVDAFPGEAPAWLGGLVRQIPDEGEDKEAFLGKLEA